MLPSKFERENNATFEEVYIPSTEQAPVNVGRNRIKVADLDEVQDT